MFRKTVLAAAIVAASAAAQAGVIISAVGGVILSGGPGAGTLTETFDQSGLATGYVSGVTDFATYIASSPYHTPIFAGFEWFSESGTTSASVYYDLGAAKLLDGMALWNEESSGIGTLDLYSSMDAVTWTALLIGAKPTDNPVADYLPDVYGGAPVLMRYMKLDMSDCPQPDPGSYRGCAIGEVAFSMAVPEPSTYALMAGGLALLGVAARRRRT